MQTDADVSRHVPTLSIILLTHATVDHLAAFAHCCKHFPLFTRIPVYATTPVISLGRTLIQDLYASTPLASTTIPSSSLSEGAYSYNSSEDSGILLQPPTNEEISTYFNLIHPLKYSQPHQPLPSPFSPPLNGLTITAYNAGHTLGGTIWHIQHGLESIVCALDWNLAKENVLAGAAWLGGSGAGGGEVIEQLRKPTALICSSKGAERVALGGGRIKRDELLLDMIKSAVKRGGTVLIPTDSSARVLELAYLLEHAWRKEAADDESALSSAGLYLASKNINATLRYTRSMLEWMDDGIVREFEAIDGQSKQNDFKQGAGPFDFKHLKLLDRQAQITKLLESETAVDQYNRSIGRVILASDTSLEWGFSRAVLQSIASDDKNLIILTDKSQAYGVAADLWKWWEQREDGVAMESSSTGENLEQVYGGGKELALRSSSRVALEGSELAAYQQWLATQRQLQTTLQPGTALEVADAADDASSVSSEDSEESEHQGKALTMAATQQARKKIGLSDEDLGINILLRKKGVHDYDVRDKKGREKMFPMVVRRRRTDDFGELIRPEDYLRAEERDEAEGEDSRSKQAAANTLGKKRKWSDANIMESDKKRQHTGDSEMNEEPEEEESEVIGPSKVTFSVEVLRLQSRLAFVDFAGLHDKRSLQMLIPLIQPRKLILVSGGENEIAALANDCRKLLNSIKCDVYTPAVNDVVDASVDTNAWTVKLTHALVKQLNWQKVKGLGIVTLTGQLGQQGEDELKTEDERTKLPILDVVPLSMTTATRAGQPLHVGDLRLAELRKLMLASGHVAEFRGEGTLLVDEQVAVRKLATGRIELESVGGQQSGNTFYAVKAKIYEGLASVAG